MGKRLIVAEKPAVGRDIANVLNCRENGEGCRIGENDVVTWAVGHLVELCYPDELKPEYAEWKIEDLPILPDSFQLKVIESGERQFEIVKKWMNDPSIDTVVCATDAGREGELIFRYIYQMAGCSKPVERLWISSLTYHAIKEGFENLKPASEYDDLYESAKCRSEADWLIGMNASRVYAVENDIRRMSIGRVMSPTLAILVEREKERRAFAPEEYCEVIASFEGYESRMIVEGECDENKYTKYPITEKEQLETFANNHSPYGEISFAYYEEETQPAQLLYDLTSLQRDANRIYGMSSKWTLDTAQSLYERHKAITYPRTDSRFLSSDIKATLEKRLESFLGGELEDYASQALESEKDLFGRFINNKGVSDHHAIIPTGEAKGMDKWTQQEKNIYDLISRRFIGMFLPDRQIVHQRVQTSIDDREFFSEGEREIIAGWSAVDKSNKSSHRELPDLEEGDKVRVNKIRIRIDKTKPPAPHTEASLLTAMEHAGKIFDVEDGEETETEFGIGTPATRAATIEKIVEKGMAVRKGRTLIPTEYGINLVSILPEVLQSPEMTGDWEHRLALISKGEESSLKFMEDIRNLTSEVVSYAIELGDTRLKDSMYVGKCPVCGNHVREYADSYYCTNESCRFRKIYKAVKGSHPTLESATMRELLVNKSAEISKGRFILLEKEPFISFEYAPKKKLDYKALRELLDYYGIAPVDKVSAGGGLWIQGTRHDEMIQDFLRDSLQIGCEFSFAEDSKALKHKCGWCLRVEPQEMELYLEAFSNSNSDSQDEENIVYAQTSESEGITMGGNVLDLIKESGFEYVDKRESGGSLWIVAGETEGKELIEKCQKLGLKFAFTAKGGRASKHRPAWYSLK